MEDKILKTIKKYKLIESGDKVLIAVSGGPDSMCLLDILNKLKENDKVILIGYGGGLNTGSILLEL